MTDKPVLSNADLDDPTNSSVRSRAAVYQLLSDRGISTAWLLFTPVHPQSCPNCFRYPDFAQLLVDK